MTFFAFHLTLGGKLDICGRDDLFFLLITTSGPAGLALKCGYPFFQISGHAPEFSVIKIRAANSIDF